ncbi:uncharacterized protein ACR2FA_002716 [Aphomia sociella]
MKISNCSHIRVRDGNAYGVDVNKIIQCIEKEYKIDFRSLTQWKELVKRLHVMTTDYNRKLQDVQNRKLFIINKIYTEFVRQSPFELTDNLARTSRKWVSLGKDRKKRKLALELVSEVISRGSEPLSKGTSEVKFTAHPNTEIVPSEEILEVQVKSKPDTIIKVNRPTHFPANICINQHKLVTLFGSPYSYLSYNTKSMDDIEMKTVSNVDNIEWLLLNGCTFIKSTPREIIINDTLEEQVIKFSLTNCSTKFLHGRFIRVIEKAPFRWAKISPVTSFKLYPGLRIVFKFIFKLSLNIENFVSYLYFRIDRDVLKQVSSEALCIPIRGKFKSSKSISVSEAVYIPPAYEWHIRRDCGFPSGRVKVSVDDNIYNLHIMKRLVNFDAESQNDLFSLEAVCPNTESWEERTEDHEFETHSKSLTPKQNIFNDVESVEPIDVIILVVSDIIELSLDSFIFEHTFLKLQPFKNYEIPVYFTKAERIGSHHCYYDFKFSDPRTEEIVMTKEVKIFAEVLPHPIQIKPNILDMSNSPVIHGFCEDNFTITNSHKVCPVIIKIKLTTKMKKILHIRPMEVMITGNSTMRFDVKLCSSGMFHNKSEDLVHFTFKIIVVGNKTIYRLVPPFFFEIIVPCAPEFKKIYQKFYRE